MAARSPELHRTNHSYATTVSFFLFLHLLLHAAAPAYSKELGRETFSFDSFNNKQSDGGNGTLTVLKDASINGGALQLTPDTRNNIPYLQNKSGRILLSRSFRLWDGNPSSNSSLTIASFNTSFLVNIFRDVNVTTVAEGLAFIIAPNTSGTPVGSDGEFLGLTNKSTDGDPSNHLIAVELDTFKQPYDPDDNHVGLDVNSVRSIKTASLKTSGIVLSPVNATNHTVWIDYNGRSRRISVYIVDGNSPKPRSPVIDTELDISKYLQRDSYFGFSGSTGERYQLNCILKWSLTVEIIPVKRSRKGSILGLSIGVPVGLLISAAVAWYLWKRKKKAFLRKKNEGMLGERLKSLPGMLREFPYGELKRATGNFHDKNKLGQGGFGVVYRGKIDGDAGVGEVAVKMFSKESKMDDFLSELAIINRLRHRHLVRLFGWCYRKNKLLLVYEYMPNGSVDWHLYKAPADSTLPWNRRYTILSGVASALNYLHNEFDEKVVHRDLKASNILLDDQFNARLGDFGLARTIDTGRTSYPDAAVPGTMGYIAPECFEIGKATRESDVYGFGAVVLEVVCGRLPSERVGAYLCLVDWVWMLHRERRILEAVDEKLHGVFDEAEAERVLMLGLACCHSTARERPRTEAIVQMIAGTMPLPEVPDFRPHFVFPGPLEAEGGTGSNWTISEGGLSDSTVGTSTLFGGISAGGWTTGSHSSDPNNKV